jgi:hypothetical protein
MKIESSLHYNPVLTVEQAAEYSGFCEADVSEAIQGQKLASVATRPDSVGVRLSAVNRWLEDMESPSGTEHLIAGRFRLVDIGGQEGGQLEKISINGMNSNLEALGERRETAVDLYRSGLIAIDQAHSAVDTESAIGEPAGEVPAEYTAPEIVSILESRAKRLAAKEAAAKISDAERGVSRADYVWDQCFIGYTGPTARPVYRFVIEARKILKCDEQGEYFSAVVSRFRKLLSIWISEQPDAEELNRFFTSELAAEFAAAGCSKPYLLATSSGTPG